MPKLQEYSRQPVYPRPPAPYNRRLNHQWAVDLLDNLCYLEC